MSKFKPRYETQFSYRCFTDALVISAIYNMSDRVVSDIQTRAKRECCISNTAWLLINRV